MAYFTNAINFCICMRSISTPFCNFNFLLFFFVYFLQYTAISISEVSPDSIKQSGKIVCFPPTSKHNYNVFSHIKDFLRKQRGAALLYYPLGKPLYIQGVFGCSIKVYRSRGTASISEVLGPATPNLSLLISCLQAFVEQCLFTTMLMRL